MTENGKKACPVLITQLSCPQTME